MSLATTLIILAIASAAFVFANLRSRRPPDPNKIDYIPNIGIQVVALIAIVALLAHLVTLITGEPLESRFLR